MATRRNTTKPAANRTFRDLMAEAQPAERTVHICLRGDLVAVLQTLEADFEAARTRTRTDSKEDLDPTAGILAEIEARQEEMRASTYPFRVRRMAPVLYRQLRAQHPPRKGDDGEFDAGDLRLGVNRDTFFPALVQRSVLDPDLTADEWQALLGDTEADAAHAAADGREPVAGLITFGQMLELFQAAHDVNEAEIDVPFSVAALRQRLATASE